MDTYDGVISQTFRDGVMNLVYQTCQKNQLKVVLKLEKLMCMTILMSTEDQS